MNTLIDLLYATAANTCERDFRARMEDLADVLERHPHVLDLLEAADWHHHTRTVHLDVNATLARELLGAMELLATAGVDLEVDVIHHERQPPEPDPTWSSARRLA